MIKTILSEYNWARIETILFSLQKVDPKIKDFDLNYRIDPKTGVIIYESFFVLYNDNTYENFDIKYNNENIF